MDKYAPKCLYCAKDVQEKQHIADFNELLSGLSQRQAVLGDKTQLPKPEDCKSGYVYTCNAHDQVYVLIRINTGSKTYNITF